MFPKQEQTAGKKVQGKYITEYYQFMFGIPMSKTWVEVFQLEILLNTLNFARVIELGTGSGSNAVFFGIHKAIRSMEVFCFDNKPVSERVFGLLKILGVDYQLVDIFENEKYIGELIKSPGKTLLYCDNGNKREELNVFCKYLKPGDMAVTHDYTEEVKKEDLDKVCALYDMKLYAPEWFDSFVSIHRAVIKL